jgi:acyl-CoA thioesterase-1
MIPFLRHWLVGPRAARAPALSIYALLLAFAMAGPRPAAADTVVRLVALGDSLTAGFNLKAAEAFPAQLEAALKARGHRVEVVNAGVSGDTTAAALARLEWAMPEGTDGAVVALGGNDALRGQPPAEAQRNLEAILERLKARRVEVLLAGMTAPRNWGEPYVREFDAIYPGLAAAHGALLYPFFLDGVALQPGLNLADGLHPNAKGVARMVEGILPLVEELIRRVKAKRGG